MRHPDIELRFINPTVGHGAFATADIPHGTIVSVKDALDLGDIHQHLHQVAESGTVMGEDRPDAVRRCMQMPGSNNSRRMRSRCRCNIVPTGYGFEIAVRDIREGEPLCRDHGKLDPDTCHHEWDRLIRSALARVTRVHQPLMDHTDPATRRRLRAYVCGEEPYTPVQTLQHESEPVAVPMLHSPHSPFSPHGYNG